MTNKIDSQRFNYCYKRWMRFILVMVMGLLFSACQKADTEQSASALPENDVSTAESSATQTTHKERPLH